MEFLMWSVTFDPRGGVQELVGDSDWLVPDKPRGDFLSTAARGRGLFPGGFGAALPSAARGSCSVKALWAQKVPVRRRLVLEGKTFVNLTEAPIFIRIPAVFPCEQRPLLGHRTRLPIHLLTEKNRRCGGHLLGSFLLLLLLICRLPLRKVEAEIINPACFGLIKNLCDEAAPRCSALRFNEALARRLLS